MSTSLDDALNIINEFFDNYPSIDGQITCRLCNTLEEIYGIQPENEAFGKIKATYHPARGEIVIPLAHVRDNDDLARSLRHEAIGHFGINTFAAREKQQVLTAIIDAREQPGIKELWNIIDQNYSGKTEPFKAEEVYAFACEAIEPNKSINPDLGWCALAEVCESKSRTMQLSDLQAITEMVSNGLRDRSRSQQIFPATDHDQFRIATNAVEVELGGRRYTAIPADELVKQNRRSIVGKVVGIEADTIYTKFGKDAAGQGQVASHQPHKLNTLPALGAIVTIQYTKDGLGKVIDHSNVKDRKLDVGS